ncbi:MAG: 7-cyano-7-deazaguanine synthase [Rhodospirillales bacterium]
MGFSGTTVLFSGGMDSTACVHFYLQRHEDVRGVFIDYGQGARTQEHQAATNISRAMGFPLETLDFSQNKTFTSGEVVGRNAFLLFTALMFSCQRSGLIATGIHGGTPYYDCSASFISQISRVIEETTDGLVRLDAPFIDWRKRDVYDYFTDADLPLKLIYSCETGGDRPCGQCASCQDHEKLGISSKSDLSG